MKLQIKIYKKNCPPSKKFVAYPNDEQMLNVGNTTSINNTL